MRGGDPGGDVRLGIDGDGAGPKMQLTLFRRLRDRGIRADDLGILRNAVPRWLNGHAVFSG